MRIRRSISVLLAFALLSISSFAWADHLSVKGARLLTAKEIHSSNERQAREVLTMVTQSAPEKEQAPFVESYLIEGKLQEGEIALTKELKNQPHDDQLRFGLGTLQFLRAVERLAQDIYRYQPRSTILGEHNMVPIIRMPVPNNPEPETLTYVGARNMMKTFAQNLDKAEATLAQITDGNVKLPLHFGLIQLDLNGDGRFDEDETLWRLYAGVNGSRNINAENARQFFIKFDRGDVHWLRGYCHLLMAMCEFYLAHDSKETFDCTAHLFFPKVDSPYAFLSKRKEGKDSRQRFEIDEVSDFISFIHLIRWPVVEPERMKAVLHHLEAVVAQSKESWKWIMAETDDDHEWLPNPRQTGVIPDVRVTDEMVSAWMNLMDQSGKVLAGERLIPFWRGDDRRGVNLRKAFLQPRQFDLVLWVQGPAAAPYLETGEMTEPGTWQSLQRAFGSQFPGFALWFN
jgi:hypothetical protein